MQYPEEDNVIVLDDSTFDDAMLDYGALMVEFFTPWCQHCKKLAPDYAQVAGILRGDDPPLRIAKVDASTSTEVASRFGVTSYPTLIVSSWPRSLLHGLVLWPPTHTREVAPFFVFAVGARCW